ncbi:AAA family ATPase [Patescibacteria group bacterium]|nr:AAA family ATPase [Patescibacteria group bacterium]
MFLEKIEIIGFKSFAKKTVLEFPRPGKGCPLVIKDGLKNHKLTNGVCGISAIVGPNGSGKSNVADAVRWALGEQSLKTLRGKKSEDVIFSGSDKKGRLGMAEVSLHINNEDGSVNIDYPQVVITRRLYRNGDAEYLINKNKVRLQDVLMLVAKANFGQKSYSIISQGMIDNILVSSPAERKDFFDEAVGVKQYQIKRDQSLNKLETTWQNLRSVEVLLNEIGPRVRSLTRQVKRLEKREVVEKELRILQKDYYGTMWHNLNRDLKNIKPKFEKISQQVKIKQIELEHTQKKLFELEKQDTRTEIFNKLQGNYQKLFTQKSELAEKQLMLKHKIELAQQKITKAEIMPVLEIIEHLKEIQKIHNQLLKEIEGGDTSQAKEKSSKLQKRIHELISNLENPKTKEAKIDEGLQKDLDRIISQIKELDVEAERAQKAIDDFNKKQDEQKGEFFELQRLFQKQQSELNSYNHQNSEIRVETARLETKLEDLEAEIKDEMQKLDWVNEFQPKSAINKEETIETIHKLKHQLELIGGIDPETIQEYKETKERFDFLTTQSEDLDKSIHSLEEVIVDLDETIHKQFDNSFKNINSEFQKYFKILFAGGKAELFLVKEQKKKIKEIKSQVENGIDSTTNLEQEQEQLTEAQIKKPWLKFQTDKAIKGIEITATPPGKKLQSINMLSGGERALTSIALICSIISNNPSPFVVLDEVDAALDEANSERFASILDELSHKTQFITITHNRATMHKANILYGVSMGDDSVSKLLSIRLEEAEEAVK